MEFRDLDYEKDIPEVVDLIRRNLNPSYSTEILKWKHLSSPFGNSVSTVAIDTGRIVGVVFALRYNYKNLEGRVLRGIRPFDACTESSHRGKGIFKILMKMCMDKYEEDYDFLMSNPNSASYPEHIKLGYSKLPKDYSYNVGFLVPFGTSEDAKLSEYTKVPINSTTLDSTGNNISVQNYFLAGNTLQFLNWRYQQKNYKINVFTLNGTSNYIVYRKERIKGINCIILCDFYGDNHLLNQVIKLVCRKERRFFIYYLNNSINENLNFFFKKKIKTAFIVYKAKNSQLPDNFVISLGDLEGRL